MTKVAHFLSIKRGEERIAFIAIGIMLLTSMGAALGGTGIEALFFARFGVEYLPYMFVGLGITSMIMSFGMTALLSRIPKRVLYMAVPLFVAVVLVLARLALISGLNWLYPALWLGKEVLNMLISLVIWGVAGLVCDARQAKRLFPLFSASRILGQVVGGFATGALVAAIGTENLLVVWAVTLLVAFGLSRTLLVNAQYNQIPQATRARHKPPTLRQEMQRGYQYVRSSSLMSWVSISTIFFSILYFSIALPFSRAVTEQYVNEDALASFLGLFNGINTAAAFLASLFLANRLYARIGIMAAVLALPVIYLVGFAGMIVAPVFIIIVAFRFVQMLWLSGIADSAWQAMFNVIPPEKRDQVRTFIEGVPSQAGTFIAGGILILGEQTLQPQQLYIVGLAASVICTFIIYRARLGYNTALIDALRAGRPHVFYSEEQPFGGFHQDVVAMQTALAGLKDTNPVVRRVSAEILGHLSLPESVSALVDGLHDSDSLVRASCLRALSRSKATPALLDIAASLSDPEPDVRLEAVSTLSALAGYGTGLLNTISPYLDDEDARVASRTAVSILRIDSENENAKIYLRQTASLAGDLSDREYALTALGEWGDIEAFTFLTNEVQDMRLPASVRKVILRSLANIDLPKALPYLIDSLKFNMPSVLETSAKLIGEVGVPALAPVLEALSKPESAEGALLALEHLPLPPAKPILDFASAAVTLAVAYDGLMRSVQAEVKNEAGSLLAESLHEKSHTHGIQALRAIGLLGDRSGMQVAIENLQTRDMSQKANVIETLEAISTRWQDIVNPLMRLWEDDIVEVIPVPWDRLLGDDDEWIRECAAFAKNFGELKMDAVDTLSLMDRILFFKKVPLFADLSPLDLKQVASLAEEVVFSDGDLLAEEGELGDEMFIIVSGEVCVCVEKDGVRTEVVRRKPGEYVGELSVVNREPRIATLLAFGDVRALCIGQKSFEGLLRERPEVGLAVIRVLGKRLKEATQN